MTKPNILMVITDQHRLSGVGAYGETVCQSPNIDRLAAEGIRFEHAYTPTTVCSPARASILTGLYAHSHGITTNIHEVGCSVHELEDRPELLSRRLQAAGYRTGYSGEWHMGTEQKNTFHGSNRPSIPSTLGFEGIDFMGGGAGQLDPKYHTWLADKGLKHSIKDWEEPTTNIRARIWDVPSDATVPAFLVDDTINQIDTYTADEDPFFISLNFFGPHCPYLATEEFVDPYRGVEIPRWANFEWDSRGIPGPHHFKIHWDKEDLNWDDWAMAIRYYYARITMIDSQIGRLYAHLEKKRLLDNTIIVFTSDHGETLGSHGGLLDKGWHHFEETHRIPLIVRMPDGTGAGTVRTEFANSIDYLPTILDLAGAEPVSCHGQSLAPLIRDEDVEWTDQVISEFLGLASVATTMKTLRVGNLKYGYNATAQDELYDLERDPSEVENRIDDPEYADRLQEMRDRLEQWMVDTEDPARRMVRWQWKQNPDQKSPRQTAMGVHERKAV